jgi:hypothetical protein
MAGRTRTFLQRFLWLVWLTAAVGRVSATELPVWPAGYRAIGDLPEVAAQSRISRQEAQLLADAADGRLDRHRLFEAAVIASGVTPQEQAECWRRVGELERELRRVLAGAPTQENARTIFEFLHRRVLCGGYEEHASNVAVTLNGGPYNCLSAVVLFVELAGRFGLDVVAVQAPGHVYCRLAGSERMDIELTCPSWFERAAREQKPAALSRDRERLLSPVELVALVYFNRGVEELKRREFAAAAAANLMALALDPASRTAEDNLVSTVNNWALAVAGEGQPSAALRLVEAARRVAPGNSHLLLNERYLHGLITGR